MISWLAARSILSQEYRRREPAITGPLFLCSLRGMEHQKMETMHEDWVRVSERISDDYSFAWEGHVEDVLDLGDVLVRRFPQRAHGCDGWIMRVRFPPERVRERLDEVMDEIDAEHHDFRWFVEPSSPPGLDEALTDRGLQGKTEWNHMVLTDLDADIPVNPEIRVEELSRENSADYIAFWKLHDGDSFSQARWEETIDRYLADETRPLTVLLPWLEGRIAGMASMRLEDGGVVYQRDAFTLPEFRGRGVYLTLVAHRVAAGRARGCTAAIVQANVLTSSPILAKRGFRTIGQQRAYVSARR